MKRFLIFCSFLFCTIFLYGDNWFSVGLRPGGMYYQGDINKSRLFYNTGFSKGGFFSIHFNERYAAKLSVNKGVVSGSPEDFNNIPQFESSDPFNSSVWDITLQVDFNFLPVTPFDIRQKNFSTYITGGIGMELSQRTSQTANFSIPFGIGANYLLNDHWGIGAEWSYRKLFADDLDGKINNSNSSLLLNNDWVSVAGITVFYKILGTPYECYTYE